MNTTRRAKARMVLAILLITAIPGCYFASFLQIADGDTQAGGLLLIAGACCHLIFNLAFTPVIEDLP